MARKRKKKKRRRWRRTGSAAGAGGGSAMAAGCAAPLLVRAFIPRWRLTGNFSEKSGAGAVLECADHSGSHVAPFQSRLWVLKERRRERRGLLQAQ